MTVAVTAQKLNISIKDFFSKCDQIRRKLRIWSHLLKKSLMENFIFCVVSHKTTPAGNYMFKVNNKDTRMTPLVTVTGTTSNLISV